MKNFLKRFLCLALIISCFAITSCSNNKDDEDDETESKIEYYSALGYHVVYFDKYTSIVCDDEDKVVISNSKIMVPNNTEISLEFNLSNNENFEMSNENYVSFADGLVLSGFNVDGKFYEISEATFKVKTNVSVSAKLNKFKTVGIAVYAIDDVLFQPEVETGKLTSISVMNQNPLHFFTNTSVSPTGFSLSNLTSNTELSTSVTSLENNKFKVSVSMAIFIETIDVKINLILSDEESNIYLFEHEFDGDFLNTEISIKNLSNKNSNLDEFVLKLGTEIDINDEYEPI
ncbi:MAG: hypothetical protein IKD36_00610 [Clostridia bacterium]|nr:hypothetical protein [Clostridia bacterium]